MSPVPARTIEPGEFFRKRTGSYVYLRLSPDSLRYHRVREPDLLVYGACFNGNITEVLPDTLVVRCTAADFLGNIKEELAWERAVGVAPPETS